MKRVQVGLVCEDVRFVRFLDPALRRIAGQCGVEADLLDPEKTSGCRPRILRQLCERIEPLCDVLVVGADASGPRHVRRRLTYRQKARELLRVVGIGGGKLVVAVAAPSVEAWLIADPQSFSQGVSQGLGIAFRSPAAWPVPNTEREAKAVLGRLVHDGTSGEHLPLGGFEYAREIVSKMDLTGSPVASLSECMRGLSQALTRISDRS